MPKKRIQSGLRLAVQAMGTKAALADALGITAQSLTHWYRVPRSRIIDVEKLTGVPRDKLAPDLFGPKAGKTLRQRS